MLPLALRIILPPLTSEFLNIIKNSSVALTIGLIELTASARALQEFSFQVFEAFAAATVIYVVLNLLVTAAMHGLERRRLPVEQKMLLYGCVVCVPITLWFGVWTETRVWMEWTLPLAALAATEVVGWMRGATRAA